MNMKIGKLVQTTLREAIEWEQLTQDEVEKFQSKIYTKDILNINYSLLLEASKLDKRPRHYYKDIVECYGGSYYICCEWYEKDRRCLLEWLKMVNIRYDKWADYCVATLDEFDEYFVTIFLSMMDGREYKRAFNNYTNKLLLESIHRDFGVKMLQKALEAVQRHINYYATLGKGNLTELQEIVNDMKRICS